MSIKRIQAAIVAWLLLLVLILPQSALADGPVISNVSYTVTNSTTVNINWTTNNNSDSRVNYGTTPALGSIVYTGTYVTSHLIGLGGLIPDTTYYFEVQSTNANGTSVDNNGGEYYSFITGPPPVGYFNIILNPVCGVCGELVDVGTCGEVIGVTAIVSIAAPTTYHICWDSLTNVKETFTAYVIGSYSLAIYTPEATKGDHKVYLVDNTYTQKAFAIFTVLPSVKIDPEEGPVGTNVTLNGYGFTASQQLQIKFKDSVIKTVTTNTVGSWNASYSIPPTPAGGYTFDIQAKEGTVWVNWVSKYFKVTPKITATPGSGTVGQTIKVDGTGFASNEGKIKVTFNGEVRKENIYADKDGSWSVTIAVPPLQSGRYIIDASGTSTRARDVPDVTFTVSPGLLVEPVSAYVGDRITVAGGGFASKETGIKVYFDGMVVSLTTITANISGCWETFFVLPASAYGSHTIGASGDITKPAVTNTINTKARIESLNPVEGAPGDTVTLIGSGFGGNKKLTVTLAGTMVPENMLTRNNGDVVVSFLVPKSIPGKQTVMVKDESGATDSVNFTVMKKVLATPMPTSPKDSTLRTRMVTFQWQGITGSNITYTLEISDTADFKSSLSKQSIGELRYQLTEEEALSNGIYYWRIKAVDKYGNESNWSSPSSFKVSPIPTSVWVIVGLVVLTILMVVAYRETKFKVTE